MSTGGIIIAVILGLVTIIVTAAPFFRQTDKSRQSDQLVSLTAHYERVLTNIRDLDEDLALGKIQPDFHEDQRARYVAEGVDLLQQIEVLQPETDEQFVSSEAYEGEELDDLIERAVIARRKGQQAS